MQKLSEDNLMTLRMQGFVSDSEIAYQNADILIAENVITGERRVLHTSAKTLLKEDKQLLKG